MDVREKINFGEYENKVPYSKLTRNAYNDEDREIRKKFREDLAKEFGMVNHPKESKLWDKAWDDGHAYGLMEVYNHYSELVDFIK